MAVLEILVQATELLGAAQDMNRATESYNEAVEQCKAAANDLASKWEGAAKDAFVALQEDAYTWYGQMLIVLRQMIDLIRKVIDAYNSMEETVKNIVKG